MAMDKQARDELRALVASEVQSALRNEMALWWAESVAALSAGRTRSVTGPGVPRQVIRPRKVGSVRQPEQAGVNGLAEVNPGSAQSSAGAPQREKATQVVSPPAERPNTDHLGLVADSLARTQLELSRELALNMQQLQELLARAQEVVERLAARVKG